MVSARMAICFETQTIRLGDLSTAWKDPEILKDNVSQQHLASSLPATRHDIGFDLCVNESPTETGVEKLIQQSRE
jgi:hypothetical protein